MMKNILVLIMVVLLGAAVYFGFKSKNLEAPDNVGNETSLSETDGGDSEENTILDTDIKAEVQSVKEFTVSGKNFAFEPSTISVKKGDKVKITFKNTEGFHDFKIDEFGVATKQAKAPDTEVLEFVASKTGTFEYYCSVGSHRSMGMVGTLTVE